MCYHMTMALNHRISLLQRAGHVFSLNILTKVIQFSLGFLSVCFWNAALALCDLFPPRGLRFIQIMLQSLADGERDENNPNHIRVNITKAYDGALKRYHGWVVQKVFKVRERNRQIEMEYKWLYLREATCQSAIGCAVLRFYTSEPWNNIPNTPK